MIYCDLDGVLADFDQAFKRETGKFPREVSRTELWETIGQIPNYWLSIRKTPDADMLLNWLSAHSYQILTGLPVTGYETAEEQKREWVKKHIGNEVFVNCCLSKDKPRYCAKGDILIDDFEPNIREWEKAGGIGILHKNATDTIEKLTTIAASD